MPNMENNCFYLMCEGFQTNMMFSPLEVVHRNDRAA